MYTRREKKRLREDASLGGGGFVGLMEDELLL
jgi:hypothetical protein